MRTPAPPEPDAIDEMVDGSGRIRPLWRRLFEQVQSLGTPALAERGRALARAVDEEGAAALLSDRDRPSWRADPLPVLMGAAEFARITEALAARADLLERVIDDVYGAQSLLASGLLPAALVFGAPAFLRSCRAPREARRGVARLSLYAADLVRAPDGSFRVVADRCARPEGIGRVLENRRLLRRVMPELFRAEVTSIAPFFDEWRDALRRSGPAAVDDGTTAADGGVVLLSEGHDDPAWFEQVLLAREIGCDLVQGGDLALRDGRLFLKTLRGLAAVAVVLSRQNPHLLDPLELDWTASGGVPGLLALARAGRVALLNGPGAALGDLPGLLAFLPRLGLHLAGADVTAALPSVDTLWLGDPDACRRVEADPDAWVIRSASDPDVPAVVLARLGARGRRRLFDALPCEGERLVATAWLPGSAAPSLGADGLEPRPVAFRLFLLRDGDRWTALPSGFVRLLGPGDSAADPLPRGGVAKDLFVVPADEDGAPPVRLLAPETEPARPPRASRVPRRPEGDLPARVAEEFFSLGRELERIETRARLLRALVRRLERHAGRPRELVELRILAGCLADTELLPPETLIDPTAHGLTAALAHLAFAGGPLATETRRTALRIERLRDRLTGEMRGTLARSLAAVLDGFAEPGAPLRIATLDRITAATLGFTATLAGLLAESMTRGGARLFLELGLRLARADTVLHEIAVAVGPAAVLPGDPAGREPGPDLDAASALLLELRDSAITYRGRYPVGIEPALVLDLLLADRLNPRALAFQLAEAAPLLRTLGEVGETTLSDRAVDLLDATDAAVRRVLDAERDGIAATIGPDLAAIRDGLAQLSRGVARRYIDLLPVATRTVGA